VLVSFLVMIVTTCTSVLLVLIFDFGVSGIIYGQILGYLAGCVLALSFSCNNFNIYFDWDKCKEMLFYSIPLVPGSLNVWLNLYFDRFAIQQLMTISDVGLYGIAFRIASMVGIIMIGFSMSLTPLIYNHYKLQSTPTELARIFRYFIILALPVMVILTAFTLEILEVLSTPVYYSVSSVIPVIALSILLSSMYIFMPGMDILKKTKQIALINLTTAAINIPLNFVMIPFFGIMGAALATLFSSFLMFSLYTYFSQKLYPIPYCWDRIVPAALVSASAVVCLLGISFEDSTESYIVLGGKIVTCFFVVAIIMWLLVEQDDLVKIKRLLSSK
jgi:O-antigen/teichoic acid export membrane protein